MAPNYNIVIFILAVALALPIFGRATEHIVGDDYGWTLDFNYTTWAQGKEFRAGDTLVFKYAVGKHNVFKVAGPQFMKCDVPPADEAMTTGNDVITLATPGKKWYICGVGHHCQMGMKLVINVLNATSHAPASPPSYSPPITGPTQHVVGDEKGWTLNFNYTAWAQGKTFRVGDSLVFKYTAGHHNVFKVGGPDFEGCKIPPAGQALTSGYDVITLAAPGPKWYVCGIGLGVHCEAGQKLAITVLPAQWQAPSPSPSAGVRITFSGLSITRNGLEGLTPSPIGSW